jgi:hypothetical protein
MDELEKDGMGVTEGENLSVETPSTQTEVEAQGEGVSESSPKPSGGDTPVAKTYSEQEFQSLIHERTRKMSEELQSYRYREQEALSKKADTVKPINTEPELTPEEKKTMEWLHKRFPQLKELDKYEKIAKSMETQQPIIDAVAQQQQEMWRGFVRDGEVRITKACSEAGITDQAQRNLVASLVVQQIQADAELANGFRSCKSESIDGAIGKLRAAFPTMFAKKEVTPASDMAARNKIKSLPTNLPKGGSTTGPLVKKPVMSDEDRIEAAFAKVKSGEGN